MADTRKPPHRSRFHLIGTYYTLADDLGVVPVDPRVLADNRALHDHVASLTYRWVVAKYGARVAGRTVFGVDGPASYQRPRRPVEYA